MEIYESVAQALHGTKPGHPGPYCDPEVYDQHDGRNSQWLDDVYAFSDALVEGGIFVDEERFEKICEEGLTA